MNFDLSQIRMIIADEMAPIREYLSMVLSREPDIKVIDTVGSRAEAIVRSLTAIPDVLLIDLEIGTPRAGVDAIKTIAALAPRIRLIVLTLFSDDDKIFSALEAGASDYVLKNFSTIEMLAAIRMAASDAFPLRPQIARLICSEFRTLRTEGNVLPVTLNILFRLLPMELSTLRLLAKGKKENEIAAIHNVDLFLISTYVRDILKKFGESSVKELVIRLERLGLSEIFTYEKNSITNNQLRYPLRESWGK